MNYFYLLGFVALLTGCVSTGGIPTSMKNVDPGTKVSWAGQSVKMFPSDKLKVGSPLPEFKVKNTGLKKEALSNDGRVKIISVVPSLDTPVCEIQTHDLAESEIVFPTIQRISVSMDLPFAQTRFIKESDLDEISYYSDYDGMEFGKSTGLLVPEKGLLARAVIVVDGKGIVRYLQVVPEITEKPNMNKAIEQANQIASEVPEELEKS